MSAYNSMALKALALDCLAFAEAHAKRYPDCRWATLNERSAIMRLEHRLAALRREDAKATSEAVS